MIDFRSIIDGIVMHKYAHLKYHNSIRLNLRVIFF